MTRLVETRVESLNKEKTKDLFSEVRASESADKALFMQMKEYRNKLRGLHYANTTGKNTRKEARIVVNLVHAHVRTMLPTVFFREPTVVARPKHPLASGKEDTWDLVLNNTLKQNGYKEETKACILDALIYHEGWKKVVQITPETEDQVDDAGGKGSKGTAETVRGPAPWGNKRVPVSIRISPLQVIVDYLAPGRDTNHARFVAVKYTRPLEEMKVDKRYTIPKDLDMKKIRRVTGGSATKRMNEPEPLGQYTTSRFEATSGVQMATFYEVWVYQDVERKLYKQCVWLMEGANVPIRMETWEDLIGEAFPGFPVHRIAFNPIPDDYPMAEVEAWQQLQESINWSTSKLVDFVSQNNQRWAIDASRVVDMKKAVTAIRSGKAVETIEVKDGSRAADAIAAIQGQGVHPDSYRLLDILIQFVERVSSLGQNQQQQGGVFRTATEANIVAQAGGIRESERVDVVADFLKRDVEKIQALIMNTADTEFVFRMAGDTGRVSWRRFDREDIQWLSDVTIKVDSFREMSMREEVVKWTGIMQIAQGLFPILGPVVRLDVIFENLLKAARVSNPEAIIGSLVGARQYQMIEIMMMMMTGESIPPQADEPHGEHIAAVEFFENSPMAAMAQEQSPEGWAAVQQHKGGHEVMLQQLREQADSNGQPQTLGQNPIDQLPGFSEANQARSQGASEREAGRTGGREQEEFI